MAEIVPAAPRGLMVAGPVLKQVGLLAGVAAAVAAAVWLVLWSQGQNYTVLYGQLSERESGQVMDALTAAGIEYKLEPVGRRVRAGSQGAGGAHPARQPGPAAERCHGHRNDSKGFAARFEFDDGERALSVRARDRARAYHHQSAGRAERAGAPGPAETLGVPAGRAQGHGLGDAAALSGPAPRAGAGRGNRPPGRLERARALSDAT